MKKLLKRLFHLHGFGPWSITEEYGIRFTSNDGITRTVGSTVEQRRTCIECGYVQIDMQRNLGVQ